VGEARDHQDSSAEEARHGQESGEEARPQSRRKKACEKIRRKIEEGRAEKAHQKTVEKDRKEACEESRQKTGEEEIQEVETLMGSALKEAPKVKTLIEKVRDDLKKRAALKAGRTLLKEPRKLPPRR
jgi:hypothetical protein